MKIQRFAIFEDSFQHSGHYSNPYREASAAARFTGPDGRFRQIPLFWDGGTTWRLRLSPNRVGTWYWQTSSADNGLDGASGSFEAVPSDRHGSIRSMATYPYHFERQDGSPFWFLGDTAWSLYVDSAQEHHNRAAAAHHVDVRAAQGFSVMHSMLMTELSWPNAGGAPFDDIGAERINPAYWQEVDHRLAYLNGKGLVAGLALAWACKKRQDDQELYAWDRFPDLAAKTRYARYIAARYSAYDVYWIVGGEWNASTQVQADVDAARREYIAIGKELRAADPHGRMMAIHPGPGGFHSVREFNDYADWMSFGDYQQNYTGLHAEVLASRKYGKPVVNGEYAYYLRDMNHDGKADKPNSQNIDVIRHATWDIVMAGGYLVTGFGSTYFGGARNPGPFDVDAPQNDDWEAQIEHVRSLFGLLPWWRLEPRDDLVRCDVPRSSDREIYGQPAPPARTYWCLAEPGEQYLLYVRGTRAQVGLSLDTAAASYRVRQFSPQSGDFHELSMQRKASEFIYQPLTEDDWVVLLQRM